MKPSVSVIKKRLLLILIIFSIIFMSSCKKYETEIWFDLIKFDDITYYAANSYFTQEEINYIKLGEVYKKVKHKIPNYSYLSIYKVKNGDASSYPRGTKVYSVEGYETTFLLAVVTAQGVVLYKADLVHPDVLFESCDQDNDNGAASEIEISDLENLSFENISELYIDIPKLLEGKGWIYKRKKITRSEDIENIIEFISAINYTNVDDQSLRCGMGQIIQFSNGSDYTFNFGGNIVMVNGKYFGITHANDEKLTILYEDMDYEEMDVD